LQEPGSHGGAAPSYRSLARGNAADRISYRVLSLAEPVAVAGGLLLAGMTALIVTAILARAFNAPITGDIEIVELFSAVAIFAMFPYCQRVRGNIQVRLFVDRMAPPARRLCGLVADLAFCGALGIVAWRMALGGIEAHHDHAQTMMLQLPKMWAYAFGTAFLTFTTALSACQIYARFRVPEA
jgi:TRAP-type C4-dicarboxylate transport system permease small subunit